MENIFHNFFSKVVSKIKLGSKFNYVYGINEINRDSESVFSSGQKMALRAVYLVTC